MKVYLFSNNYIPRIRFGYSFDMPDIQVDDVITIPTRYFTQLAKEYRQRQFIEMQVVKRKIRINNNNEVSYSVELKKYENEQ